MLGHVVAVVMVADVTGEMTCVVCWYCCVLVLLDTVESKVCFPIDVIDSCT